MGYATSASGRPFTPGSHALRIVVFLFGPHSSIKRESFSLYGKKIEVISSGEYVPKKRFPDALALQRQMRGI